MNEAGWGSLRPIKPSLARPFLKWAGGKGQVFPSLKPYFPPLQEDQTYFEPFLGGGAVFFALSPHRAVLSDINHGLTTTFEAIKLDETAVLSRLHRMPPPARDEEYYQLRDHFNDLLPHARELSGKARAEFASVFIWLNHTCYNGLFRVNKQGKFNVPYGYYENPFIYSERQIRAAARTLRSAHARITTGDYEKVLSTADRGDLAYLDPPYDPISETSSFTNYTVQGFDVSEQERLARVVSELVERGCRVVLSNSPSPRVIELYKGYRTARVLVPRAINSVGNRRTPVDELVIVA